MMLLFRALLVVMLAYEVSAQAGPDGLPAGSSGAAGQEIMQEDDLMSLAGARWSETPHLRAELARVEAGVGQLLAAGETGDVLRLIGRSNGCDLLAQAVYRGLITSADHDHAPMDVLKRFRARIGETGDPVDIPDGLRSWIPKSVMHLYLAERIKRIDASDLDARFDPARSGNSARSAPERRRAERRSAAASGSSDAPVDETARMAEAEFTPASGRYIIWVGGGLVVLLATCSLAIRR